MKRAIRNVEPFERLIEKRKYLPNVMSRFCTSELNVIRIRKPLESRGFHDWIQCIGIRADEPRRAIKLNGKKPEGPEMYLPLFLDGVTKEPLGEFWKQQPFDVMLPNINGVTDWGNCDLCFLKGYKIRLSIMREKPQASRLVGRTGKKPLSKVCSVSAARFRNDTPILFLKCR